MEKLIFISNRLPVTVKKTEAGFEYLESIGGLATGLKSYHERADSVWLGWLGLAEEGLTLTEKDVVRNRLNNDYKCLPVFLSSHEINKYYDGFCNNTIWPLFHYFTNKTENDPLTWEAYRSVNEKFFEVLETIIGNNDIIWIHDYHLMLLPRLIKEKYPQTKIGFFLHIPFPSFEIFRLLVWREDVLKGLLGADLIGFHTYDYVRHFLSSVRRLLGLDHSLNKIIYEGRAIQVDAFPMGIDYDYFAKEYDVQGYLETAEFAEQSKNTKVVLSVDRLDYTKGIPERIKAFSHFLAKYPEYREKVILYLIVAPSREEIGSYGELLKEIEESVSKLNGMYGSLTWMPIWFFFRSFIQKNLIYFYRHADVLLVTPLRDGMNLIAKEYVASRTDYDGMLVISETAGAASELPEAVIVNVNNRDAIAAGIKTALEMPRDEKTTRNQMMHKRLQRYNVKFWASEFLSTLKAAGDDSNPNISAIKIENDSSEIENAYQNSQNRVLFLDYDGTLVGFKSIPEQAKPDWELINLLSDLANDPDNTVVIVSGRDKYFLERWFGDLNIHILASHGLWLRHPYQEWIMTTPLDNDWKDSVRSVLETYTDRTPGSFIEEKDYSVAWHYRQCEPYMLAAKLSEIRENLMSLTRFTTLGLQEGSKVLEVKDTRVNKGYVSSMFIQHNNFDFILGAGDDYTDEDLFLSLPKGSFSIKIGIDHTSAGYQLKSWQSMRALLNKLVYISKMNKN